MGPALIVLDEQGGIGHVCMNEDGELALQSVSHNPHPWRYCIPLSLAGNPVPEILIILTFVFLYWNATADEGAAQGKFHIELHHEVSFPTHRFYNSRLGGRTQENGRHEQMHLTLKQEATKPPSYNSLQQQARFEDFVEGYNN